MEIGALIAQGYCENKLDNVIQKQFPGSIVYNYEAYHLLACFLNSSLCIFCSNHVLL